MNRKVETLIGITPKCLQEPGKSFIGANGELWPCCWLYSMRKDLHDWANRNNCNMSDLDLNRYTIQEVHSSKLMTMFQKSFDTETCRRECSSSSWKNNANSKRGDAVIT